MATQSFFVIFQTGQALPAIACLFFDDGLGPGPVGLIRFKSLPVAIFIRSETQFRGKGKVI